MEMLSSLAESIAEQMDSLKESTSFKKNQAVLDNLGENENGDLTYKGKVVGGTAEKPLVMIDPVVDFVTTAIHAAFTNCMTIETALMPNNARVKKIEIPDVVNGTDEYIQLEDMVAKDPYGLVAPYFIMYPKNATGNLSTVAASAVFPTVANNFYEMAGQHTFLDKTIKIYYEIEE